MTTILDLPDEIHLIIGKQLNIKAFNVLIRVCRFFNSAYIPCLWSELVVKSFKGSTIGVDQLHANAHHVETLIYSPSLTEDYYTIIFPRLRCLRMIPKVMGEKDPNHLKVQPHYMTQFARLHPTIRHLEHDQPKLLSKEFWGVVESEWKEFESLELSGIMDEDVGEAFWKVCGRLRTLRLIGVMLPKDTSILSSLCFPQLQRLSIAKYHWQRDISYQTWPLQLLERVRKSPRLRHLRWAVLDIPFPVLRFQEMLAEEGCWPELCELDIGYSTFDDQDLATILRSLPSRRLTDFDWANHGTMGPLTYKCLRETYFGHLRVLKIAECRRVTSVMAQELLAECVHLIAFYAPYINVRDIATASKPWGCLNLEDLTIYVVKKPEDEAGWEDRVFEQIGKLRRLLVLDLNDSGGGDDGNDDENEDEYHYVYRHLSRRETLDLRRCCLFMSSLVQLRILIFDGQQQGLGMKEALWMLEHWKDLQYIRGAFMGVMGDRVDQLFAMKGISYSK